jgi:hypothetical protein
VNWKRAAKAFWHRWRSAELRVDSFNEEWDKAETKAYVAHKGLAVLRDERGVR